jgi:DNA-binding winged helix-turn-helix (wHTH) protein
MNKQVNIGDWQVDWDSGWIKSRRTFWTKRHYPDPRIMAVLGLLAERAGEIVSVENILDDVWHDRVVGRDSVSTAIYQLRQLLGDQSQRSTYIKTEARRGYRLVAEVSNLQEEGQRAGVAFAGVAAVCLVMVGGAWAVGHMPKQDPELILIEQMGDQTTDDSMRPLHEAIGSTLVGELVNQLPGRVILESSPVPPAYTLQSLIVACDLGPTLLVRLMDTEDNRYLWYQSYRLDDWADGLDKPTLVQAVAGEVGAFVNTL